MIYYFTKVHFMSQSTRLHRLKEDETRQRDAAKIILSQFLIYF